MLLLVTDYHLLKREDIGQSLGIFLYDQITKALDPTGHQFLFHMHELMRYLVWFSPLPAFIDK